MTRPWNTLATAELDDGGLLELRQRGESDFLIVIDGRVLMNSFSRRSEEELSRIGLADVKGAKPRVLIGGLGMAFTLRAALDVLPPGAEVTVAELNPVVLEWCKGPLGPATNHAVADPRVTVSLGDVAELIGTSSPGRFDAILLDLYEGPNDASQGRNDPFYSVAALAKQRASLAAGGVLAVWSEDADAPYEKRFKAAGFTVTVHKFGTGGRKHVVYVGRRS